MLCLFELPVAIMEKRYRSSFEGLEFLKSQSLVSGC